MLEIQNIGREEYENYGPYFIDVIRKFKNDLKFDSNEKKDQAAPFAIVDGANVGSSFVRRSHRENSKLITP